MARINDLGLDTLHTRLRDRMNELADDISLGACKDFPEYRYKAGVIWGLGVAERELLDLAKEMEEKD